MLKNASVLVPAVLFAAFVSLAGCVSIPLPAAPSRYLDYQTQTPLALPFEGEWFVLWGGPTKRLNDHAHLKDVRFAYDFVMVSGEEIYFNRFLNRLVLGKTHQGRGKVNEDYDTFARPVFAPAGGEIVTAVDGIPDNKPGVRNHKRRFGNYVVIDHANGEYSFVAHLKKDTVSVRPGQMVLAGDLLGLCGNSGNSSEPHLHYHLQNSPAAGEGEGLPAQFRFFEADGKPVERGGLERGQSVRPLKDHI